MTATVKKNSPSPPGPYVLDEQVGFLLRQVSQRHAAIFAGHMGQDLTPTQWAALVRLLETGPGTQNLLGRLTAMDAATIKGVIDRLTKRRLTETHPDPEDGRRVVVALTPEGRRLTEEALTAAHLVTEETLAPLAEQEREVLKELLRQLL